MEVLLLALLELIVMLPSLEYLTLPINWSDNILESFANDETSKYSLSTNYYRGYI